MKRITLFILSLVLVGSVLSSLPAVSSQADCGGAINIYGPPNHKGCLVNQSTGEVRCFTMDRSGYHFEGKLCAGKYYICIEDWGNGTFVSDGASEMAITISNNADCNCSGCP